MLLLRVALCVALASASIHAGGVSEATAAGFEHADLDSILRATIRGEGVDYPMVRARYLPDLERYLDRVAAAKPEMLSRDERLALFINLYNAAVLHTVAQRYEPGYSVSRDSFGIFDEKLVRIEGKTISLNQLEHEIIRPRFKEPRIHVALVCAARSCPPLISRAYRADDLEDVLERNMRRFVNDRARNRIDAGARRLELSRIFEWYAEDFGGSDGLARYVDAYTETTVSGYDVGFGEYSWELNLVGQDEEE